MFAQTKGSLVQRELARERLRDCKSVEIAEKKKHSFLSIIRFHARFFFVSAGAKKKLTKRNAVKEMR